MRKREAAAPENQVALDDDDDEEKGNRRRDRIKTRGVNIIAGSKIPAHSDYATEVKTKVHAAPLSDGEREARTFQMLVNSSLITEHKCFIRETGE